MFKNYIKIALRALSKNKVYAIINVVGLALGMTVYLFGGIMADYERNHDTMFANHARTYTIGSVLSPNANIGVKELDYTYSAMGPLIKAEMPEAEAVVRTIRRGYLVSVGENNFHESLRFADSEFTQIFDLNYIQGDASALTDPKGVILTESYAKKFFGRTDVLGETLMLNHEHDLHVKAVIKELPQNSHFNSFILSDNGYDIIAPLTALNRIAEWNLDGNWNNLSTGNYVYVMTKDIMPLAEVDASVNAIFDSNVEAEVKEAFMASLRARHLKDTNAAIWDMIGMPVIESVQLLGVLVLVIAIVNYTNLATAQSMGRAREVGMRKTLGAERGQLMAQFLTESLTIAFLSMILAIAFLEMVVPLFNVATDKVVSLDYMGLIPWLLLTTVIVGLVAGAYPSYLITKISPIDALKNMNAKGAKGSFFRSLMIGTQFMISIFMLAIVMIVFFQNDKVKESSNIFPKDEVLTLKKMSKQSIRDREDVLRAELMKLPAVEHVSFASQVPFEQSNNTNSVSRVKGDESAKFQINNLAMDAEFLNTFDIPLLAGRGFSMEIGGDFRENAEVRNQNVIVNEMVTRKLGFKTPLAAVGEVFWGMNRDDGKDNYQYNIIGVVPDQNILGLHNKIKPWIFGMDWDTRYYGAIRLKKGFSASVITDIEQVWEKVIPDYPIEHEFLNGIFNGFYKVYKTMNMVLAGFSALALALALIGLFGLAAFMARGRTKEIGIRKVLGATMPQLVKLLIWQFSRPVMWAILVAMPLAYFASGMYLQFFAERIDTQIPIIIVSGLVAVGLAWGVIAMHAIKVARSNPIMALRYE